MSDAPLAPDDANHKYSTGDGPLTQDDHDDEEDESRHEAVAESQSVKVTFHRPESRDLRYTVHVVHTESRGVVASHASRSHRIAESNQWDPMGDVDWTDLPVRVRRRVADVVAGVDGRGDLDPGFRFIDDTEATDD